MRTELAIVLAAFIIAAGGALGRVGAAVVYALIAGELRGRK